MSNPYVNDFNTTIQTYYNDLKRSKPLTREKETLLFKKARLGDITARTEILESNLKFVFDVSKKYKGKGVSIEDLVSEGNVGLVKAFDKFDETRNIRFISYAIWWIKQAIQESIKKRNTVIKHECGESDLYDEETDNEFADIEDDNDVCTCVFEKSNIDEIVKKENEKNNKEVISRLLTKLSPRARYIVSAYYGLDGENEKTLEEIGTFLNLSKERVRQIKLNALKMMRSEILLTDYSDLSF